MCYALLYQYYILLKETWRHFYYGTRFILNTCHSECELCKGSCHITGTMLEMQTLRYHMDVPNQKQPFNKMVGDFCALSSWEGEVLESIPRRTGNWLTKVQIIPIGSLRRGSELPDWLSGGHSSPWFLPCILTPSKQSVFNSVYTLELPEKFLLKYYYLDSTPDLLNKNVLGKGRKRF